MYFDICNKRNGFILQLAHGADPTMKNQEGQTAIDLATVSKFLILSIPVFVPILETFRIDYEYEFDHEYEYDFREIFRFDYEYEFDYEYDFL